MDGWIGGERERERGYELFFYDLSLVNCFGPLFLLIWNMFSLESMEESSRIDFLNNVH